VCGAAQLDGIIKSTSASTHTGSTLTLKILGTTSSPSSKLLIMGDIKFEDLFMSVGRYIILMPFYV